MPGALAPTPIEMLKHQIKPPRDGYVQIAWQLNYDNYARVVIDAFAVGVRV